MSIYDITVVLIFNMSAFKAIHYGLPYWCRGGDTIKGYYILIVTTKSGIDASDAWGHGLS